MNKILILMLFLLSFNLSASNILNMEKAVIMLPPPGSTVTALFFNITNHSNSDLKILKVSGDFASNFEMHKMQKEDGKMQMRPVENILVPKNATTELKSGGLHIMVFSLKKTLIEGAFYKIILSLDNKTNLEFKAVAKKH